VVVFHVAFYSARQSASFRAAYGAVPAAVITHLDLSVFLFFVLSGYLIPRPFVAAFIADRPMPALGDYAIARILRIVPAFWVVFTLLLLRHGSFGTGPLGIASVYLFAQNYHATFVSTLVGPAWTLDIEVIFYALVPLAAIAMVSIAGRRPGSVRTRVRIVLAAVAGVAAVSLLGRAVLPQTAQWQIAAPAMLYAFMPGVACAALEQTVPAWLRAHTDAGRLFSRGLLALAVALGIVYVAGTGGGVGPARFGVAPVLADCSAGLLLAAALVREWAGFGPWMAFGAPPMRWIGERSYGLYLVHQGLLFDLLRWRVAIGHAWERFLALLPVTLAGGLLAAALLFALVERPAMSLRRRLVAPRRLGVGGRAA
jgi:peptidoglycan/LPS O-acetylase OafA/YrhL